MMAVHVARPGQGEDEHAHRSERASEEAQEIEGGGIRPLQIIEEQDHWLLRRRRDKEIAHLGKELAGTAGSGMEGGRQRWDTGQRRELGSRLSPWAVGRRLGEVVAAPDE